MSQRFLNLIRKGETAEVAAIAEEDSSVVASRDAQGISALLWSVYAGQPLIRDFLLTRLNEIDFFEASAVGDCSRLATLLKENAVWVYQTSADGWSPLHLAAAFGGREAAALLLAHGAHVHQSSRNPMHNQPLHACIALSRDLDTVRLLLDQGADVNAAQAGGYTPLHQAAAAGRRDLVELLLAAGADPARLCDQGKTPRQYASERGYQEIVELLPV
ncbi:MAG TPA: ankyrin repeat domain-containing protein [Acidobacteriaceae bacterium]|nr:ankyrin repeat domain-containing protein [Acidobacteriaceae bacterium]